MTDASQTESIESHMTANNNLPLNGAPVDVVESSFLGISFDGFTSTQSCKYFEAQHNRLGASYLSLCSHFEFKGNESSLDPCDVHLDLKMAHLFCQLSLS